MKKLFISQTHKQSAKVSGFAIVIMAIAAVLANDLSIVKLFAPEDASETFNNVLKSQMLFRIGVFSWLIILISDLFAAWGLYLFFKPVNEKIALIAAWLRIAYIAILGASILNLIKVLFFIDGNEYLSVLGNDQIQTQVWFYISTFFSTWSFGLIVFGIHIMFLGYLLLSMSGKTPKIFGIVLIIAFIGYVIVNSTKMFFPHSQDMIRILGQIFLIPMLGEVALGIWLLILGFKKNSTNNQNYSHK